MLMPMAALEQMQTRLSLLFRLTQPGPLDERAWQEFVDHYAPLIYSWCRKHRLQDADAKDVTQQVMLKLATHLPSFSYDPSKSFRAWLRTLSYHAWVDFLSDQKQRGSGDTGVWRVLTSAESREDLLKRIDDEFDLERLEQAMARVRDRVEPATWEAFRLTAIVGVPAAEVARRLSKQVATIYVSRSNVQKMLQEEIALLEASREGPCGGGATAEQP
jgi:RNA polymerase sigma-70 factor (ECF subfamily)